MKVALIDECQAIVDNGPFRLLECEVTKWDLKALRDDYPDVEFRKVDDVGAYSYKGKAPTGASLDFLHESVRDNFNNHIISLCEAGGVIEYKTLPHGDIKNIHLAEAYLSDGIGLFTYYAFNKLTGEHFSVSEFSLRGVE